MSRCHRGRDNRLVLPTPPEDTKAGISWTFSSLPSSVNLESRIIQDLLLPARTAPTPTRTNTFYFYFALFFPICVPWLELRAVLPSTFHYFCFTDQHASGIFDAPTLWTSYFYSEIPLIIFAWARAVCHSSYDSNRWVVLDWAWSAFRITLSIQCCVCLQVVVQHPCRDTRMLD